MYELYRVSSDGYLDYFFHDGQFEAWENEARFLLVLSGTQGGKTSWGPPWFYREIQRMGPGDYLVATPTFPLLHVKALPEFRKLFESVLRLGRYVGSPVRRFEFSRAGLAKTFGPGNHDATRIYFGHAQDPDSLEAATYKAAWLDEAGQKKFKLGSWEAIQRRLSIYQGRALFTTTPYYLGWLKREVWDRAVKGEPGYGKVRFPSIQNPAFPKDEWERVESTMPRWKFDLFYRAVWSRPAGLIYDSFLDDLHTCPRFDIPDTWERFLGLDFGGTHLAANFYAKEPRKEKYYLYRVYKAGKKTARQHTKEILSGEPGIPYTVGGAKSEGQWRREFKAAGLPVKAPKIKEVELGIQWVWTAHQEHKIIVFDDLTDYLDEKASYARVLDEAGEPTEQIEDKSTYHILDAERAIGTHIFNPHFKPAAKKKIQSYQG